MKMQHSQRKIRIFPQRSVNLPATAVHSELRSLAYQVPKVQRYGRIGAEIGAATAPAPGPVALEIENRTPHRDPSIAADVGVPFMQAVITAAIAGVVVLAAGVLAELADSWRYGVGAFVVVLAMAWLWRLGVVTSLLAVVERITQSDLDGSGGIGDTAHTMLENPGAARAAAATLARERSSGIRTAELLGFLTRCAAVGTSENKLGIAPSPSERARYKELRDTLIALGIGRWRDHTRPRLGWELVLSLEDAAPLIRRHVAELRTAAN